MKIAVLGLGSFGEHVARTLFEDGHEVLAVDKRRDRAEAIKPFVTNAVIMDGAHKDNLEALAMKDMDAVVVGIGPEMEATILAVYHLREMGVKRILAKALNEDHARILQLVGATEVVYPERDMALRTAKRLSRPNVLESIPLAAGASIEEIRPPVGLIGKSLRQLDLRNKMGILVLAVRSGGPAGQVVIPSADYVIRGDDLLVVLGGEPDLKRIHPS